MDLLQRFYKNWISKKFLVNKEQPVLLAVSGGIDSMVMADLFLKSEISFAVAHCNFQLREEEADKDEQLVKAWAEKNNISFHTTRFDTNQSAEEWKKGIQETARILRYEWLDMIKKENDYSKIATAHHANDNAETLLMNLFKGTGIAGLHAIPEQNNNIIRPVLFMHRSEITAYAQENNILYREDASNATDHYLRNSVRHNIIPVVEQLFPQAIQHISESINRFSEAEQLYRRAIEIERKGLIEQRGKDLYIPVLKLLKKQPLNTICYELFTPFGFTVGQIPFIIQLCEADSGKFIDSDAYRILKDRDFLIVTTRSNSDTDKILIEGVPCTIQTGHCEFKFNIEKNSDHIPISASIACIDSNKITFPLILRKWKQGDYFYPLGMGMKKKKLSKFFIDQKIPIHFKEQTWVLECDKRIVWIAGMRLDERFKVNKNTEHMIRIKMDMSKNKDV